MRKIEIPKNELKKLIDKGLKIKEIAEAFNCSETTIRRVLGEYDLHTYRQLQLTGKVKVATDSKNIDEDPYVNLSAAIIRQAFFDYEKFYRSLKKGKREAEYLIAEILMFFRSPWYRTLSVDADIEEEAIMAKIRQSVDGGQSLTGRKVYI